MNNFWFEVFRRSYKNCLELMKVNSTERLLYWIASVLLSAFFIWYYLGDTAGTSARLIGALAAPPTAGLVIFIYGLAVEPMRLYSELADKLLKQTSQNELKSAQQHKRLEIARLLNAFEDLKQRCQNPAKILESEVNDLYVEAQNKICCLLGEDYLHRFNSDSGAPPEMRQIGGTPNDNARVWNFSNRRAYRLNQFLEELSLANHESS